MAKSLRSHARKRARAEMRATVGKQQEKKVLRKTTRSILRAVAGAEAAAPAAGATTLDNMRALLSGAGVAATLEPTHKKKLRYSFNAALRERRLADGVEDETDDEALEKEELEAEDAAEGAGGEPVPTGAATAGTDPIIREVTRKARGAGGAGAMDTEEGEEEEDEEGAEGAIEQAGRKMAADKPVGKREMSSLFYHYAERDRINPHVAGMHEVPAGKRKQGKLDKKAAKHGGRKASNPLGLVGRIPFMK